MQRGKLAMNTIIQINHKDIDFSGYNDPHQCHYNAYNYLLDNCDDDCHFVCCLVAGTPHCIVKVGDEYIDPTTNIEREAELVSEYTYNQISDIFDAEGMTFNPSEWTYSDGKLIRYDGMNRIEREFC